MLRMKTDTLGSQDLIFAFCAILLRKCNFQVSITECESTAMPLILRHGFLFEKFQKGLHQKVFKTDENMALFSESHTYLKE